MEREIALLTYVVCCGVAPEQGWMEALFNLFTSDGYFKVPQQLRLHRNTLNQFNRQ